MKMRFLAILPLLLLGLVPLAAAQQVKVPNIIVDFSGRWVSESVKMQTRPRLRLDQNMEMELVVTQTAKELKVKETTTSTRGDYSRDVVYYLDGRGESNKGFTDGFVYETKTEIKDQKLFINGTVNFSGSSSSQTQEWNLSADGKKLTIKTMTTGRSAIHYEKVFRLES